MQLLLKYTEIVSVAVRPALSVTVTRNVPLRLTVVAVNVALNVPVAVFVGATSVMFPLTIVHPARIVDCAYVVDMKSRIESVPAVGSSSAGYFEERVRRLRSDPLGMKIAPDSIKFYLFEKIEVGPNL